MQREELSELVLSATETANFAIVDVRDSGKLVCSSPFKKKRAARTATGQYVLNLHSHPPDLVDHIGGHIFSSIWAPSASLDARLPELIRTLSDKKKVIFHCALSQQRGPSAALRYARQRAALLAPEQIEEQQIYVLEGGFMSWQELYGTNPKLTEAYIADIWKNY